MGSSIAQEIFGECDLTVVSARQPQQQRYSQIVGQSRVCFSEIRSCLFGLSPAEEMLADKYIQRCVSVREISGTLKFGDALRNLLILDEYKTFIDQFFKSLLVRDSRARQNPQTQFIAMNVLFLFQRVSLAALAPHSFEPLGFDHAVFSQ